MVSIVIPCLDEAERLPASLGRITSFLATQELPWEVIVVDDGSRDGTSDVVHRRFGDQPRIRLIRYEENHGKGWALRRGFAESTGQLVLFTDADLATPIEFLSRLLVPARSGMDLVLASRTVSGARILTAQPLRRRLAGLAFRLLVRSFRLTSVSDTQCGFKLLRRATMAPIVEAIETDDFAFDVELLMRAERAGLGIAEVPVDWHDVSGSKLRLYPDAVRMAMALMRFRRDFGASGRSRTSS